MKFEVETGHLKEAVSKLVGVVDKRNTRPILTYLKAEVVDSKLALLATDLEVSAKILIPAQSQEETSFCVNAKNLYEVLQELPDKTLTIEVKEENKLKLNMGEIDFELLIYKSEDFPHLVFQNVQNEFLISSKQITEIINKTYYAISNDETRLYLNGIFVQDMNGKLRAVATDGHRLALLDTNVLLNSIDTLVNGIIIPKKGIGELKKIAEAYSENDLKISVDESFIYVTAKDNYFLSIRLIAREYPKYQAVIPNKTSFTLRAQKDQLLSAVKRTKVMSNEKSYGVRAKLTNNQLTLSANHPSLGAAYETVNIDYEGKEMEIGFNAKYLMDALASIEDTDVILELNNELSPIIIRAEKMPHYLGIIMPLKL